MKVLFLLCLVALTVMSCSSPAGKQEERDTTDTSKIDVSRFKQQDIGPQELCFLHTEGKKNQDSTLVHLVINGYQVSGAMLWHPYGKDSREGPVYGKKAGYLINVVWKYNQGGKNDSLKTVFELDKNKLAQKAYEINSRNGTRQTDTAYTIIYNKIKCGKIHLPVN